MCESGLDATASMALGHFSSPADAHLAPLLVRLAAAGSEPATGVVGQRHTGLQPQQIRDLMWRRAKDGSPAALAYLLRVAAGIPELAAGTIAHIEQLAEAGSEPAIAAVTEHRLWSPSLLRRHARLGSEAALRALTRSGVEPEDWELLEERASWDSAVAIPLTAWRQWAVATGGPDVRTGLEPSLL